MKINNSKKMAKDYKKYFFSGVEIIPNIIKKGKGSFIWDIDGNKILDLNAGQFCSIFGHSWSPLGKIVNEQLIKICHTSTQVVTPEVLKAAKNVSEICGNMNGKVLFLSTGSEAVECALRFAKHIKKKSGFVCFDNGYHGLTLGSQSVTFGGKWAFPKVNFIDSITPPVFHELEENDRQKAIIKSLKKLERIFKNKGKNIAGFIMEAVISVGGMNFLTQEYCEGIYKLCKKYNIFLIYDECQTGFGRTGKWFSYQHFNLIPDILVSAKGMGIGFPVSMIVFKNSIINSKNIEINHYSSHQNDPLSAVIVSKVIDEIKNNKLLDHVKNTGKYFLLRLTELSKKYKFIKNPRGMGLMLGFDIFKEGLASYRELGNQFLKDLLSEGILLQSTSQGRTYRLLPNYYVSRPEINFLMDKLEVVIKKLEYKNVK